jgi:anti-sigma28 factor (negative regulator of flagellin synthesis)
MRIDDLYRAPQSQESAKTEGVQPDRSQNGAASRQTSDADAASISGMATALSPSESRLEALRLQVERGQYNPSSNDVAAKLIDEHTLDQ